MEHSKVFFTFAICSRSFLTTVFSIVFILVGLLKMPPGYAGGIQRVNLDGSNLTTLVSGIGLPNASPNGLALDLEGGHIYWTSYIFEPEIGKIQRANLDGTGVVDLLSTPRMPEPSTLALDLDNDTMYWTDFMKSSVDMANIDGTEYKEYLINFVVDRGTPIGLALGNDSIYVGHDSDRQYYLSRANLDGSDLTRLLSDDDNLNGIPRDIELDFEGGHMYWTVGEKIQRSNLNGESTIDIITSDERANGLALDIAGGYIYWTEWGGIKRANLDGSGVTDIVLGLKSANRIDLDLSSGYIYFTSAVPELSTWAMMILGLAIISWKARRQRTTFLTAK